MKRLLHVLLPLGLFVIIFGLGQYHSQRRGASYRFGSQNSLWWYLALTALHIVANYVAGLPDEPQDVQPAAMSAVLSSISATAAFSLLQVVVPGLLPRFVVTGAGLLSAPWAFSCSLILVYGERRRRSRDRVLAIVSPADQLTLSVDADRSFPLPEIGFTLVGFVDPAASAGVDINELAGRLDPTVVVLSEEAQQNEGVVAVASALHVRGVRVRSMTLFCDEWLGKLPLSELGPMALMFDIGDLHRSHYVHVKRIVDFLGGLLGCLFVLVLSPVIAIFNLAGNRGPLFFFQTRTGLGGVPFRMVKFRTMMVSGEENEPMWTASNDARVTSFGGILRRSHIDELPQMWNVLRGELSLVGPRPEQPLVVRDLETKVPFFGFRHVARPGITGWAQVKYGYAASEADAIEKVQYDLYYLRHQSLTLDLRILSRTARSVLLRRGR